jgi:hypothetical protein
MGFIKLFFILNNLILSNVFALVNL